MEMDTKKVYETIDWYGADYQTTVCMEECGELIQAIAKMKRGKNVYSNLVEEMADVLISIELLKQIYHVDENDLKGWVDFKVNRNYEKMLAAAEKMQQVKKNLEEVG